MITCKRRLQNLGSVLFEGQLRELGFAFGASNQTNRAGLELAEVGHHFRSS
jgi:hypothetical protein